MKMRSKQIKNMIFYILLLVLAFSVYSVNSVHSNLGVLFTNMIIIVLSLTFMIIGDKYNYSLNKMFMLFSFFFFGIAPVLQYQHGRTIWRGPIFDDYSYIRMNIIIILILLTYQGLYYIFGRLKSSKNAIQEEKKDRISIYYSKNILLLLTLLSMLITLYYNNFNITNLFFRAGGEVDRIDLNQSIRLIYSNFIRPIPIVSLVLYKISNTKDKRFEFILVLIVLLTNFPTSRARFYIAAVYIPLVLLYINKFSKRYLLFNKVLLIGFLFIFPFLDQARRVYHFTDFKFGLDFRMFLDGHFDSFQMFMRVVDENFITLGGQLVSSLLFFVPRSVWPGKSIGSGALMSNELGLSFDNISMNFFGEGFINFGYFGILVFVCIIAYVNAKLDKNYWYEFNKNNKISPYYLVFLGLEFFILRGDLMSSVAFTTGLLFSIYSVNKLAIRKIDKVDKNGI